MTDYITRFSARQRLEHFTIMVLFIVLSVTGLPQKYFYWGLGAWTIDAIGGIDRVRLLHRAAGLAFCALIVFHIGAILFDVARHRCSFSMVPTKKDFTDAIAMLRYYLRLSDEKVKFGRFDYKQKFEYWGLVMGGLIVGVTGLMLLYPIQVTQWLPGALIPAAKMAHSYEGLMAFLVVVTWHVYNAHLSPDVFPFDTGIFTGKISRERMAHEHPLELEALEQRTRPAAGGPEEPRRVA